MGFYDTLTFSSGYAECGIAPGARWQTKSLGRGGDEFRVTHSGKLLLERCRYEENDQVGPRGLRQLKRVATGNAVVPFHGDLLLIGEPRDSREEFVARFTHGKLEWVRPLSRYSRRAARLLTEIGSGD